MGTLSPFHWLLVILVILLVFGPTRLAGVGKGLGEGIRNFKKGLDGDSGDDKQRRDPPQLPGGEPPARSNPERDASSHQ